MKKVFPKLCRTAGVLTPIDRLVDRAADGFAACGAMGRHFEDYLFARSQIFQNLHDLGDDLAAFFDDDLIANANILALDFVDVMQRRSGDLRTGKKHRLQVRHRGYGPCASHLALDRLQRGDRLLGRKFVRHHPTRRL